MNTNMVADFFFRLITADFSFAEIGESFNWLMSDIAASPHISDWWGAIMSSIADFEMLIPIVLLALGALILFAGKRLFLFLRCLAFFIAGFVFGVWFVSPYVLMAIPTMPTWFVGLVIGIVAAVLSRILYVLLYAIVPTYLLYMLFSGSTIPAFDGMYYLGGIIALIGVISIFLLRKYIEMLGTAVLGGYIIAVVVRGLYDYTVWSIFGGNAWLGMLIFAAILTPIGFFVQFKTRKRY